MERSSCVVSDIVNNTLIIHSTPSQYSMLEPVCCLGLPRVRLISPQPPLHLHDPPPGTILLAQPPAVVRLPSRTRLTRRRPPAAPPKIRAPLSLATTPRPLAAHVPLALLRGRFSRLPLDRQVTILHPKVITPHLNVITPHRSIRSLPPNLRQTPTAIR